jgi:hypothetical protein
MTIARAQLVDVSLARWYHRRSTNGVMIRLARNEAHKKAALQICVIAINAS